MKRSSVRIALMFVLLVGTLIAMSSCNRGYGCPSDFSIGAVMQAPTVVLFK